MRKLNYKARSFLLLLGLACYLAFCFNSLLSTAYPGGADVINLSTVTYSVAPDSRSDLGGTITTTTLSTIQQDAKWKAYVGNISGTLVLRNTGGWSIYQWALNASTISANIFVSRSNSISWDDLVCASVANVTAEQTFLGLGSASTDNINRTFNSTSHRNMTVSSVGTIANSSCKSTATYVNGTAQTVTESAYFQEILLSDNTNLVYATFVNQDAWGYDNNATGTAVTYDFQLIVAENETASVGTAYYFYADLSS